MKNHQHVHDRKTKTYVCLLAKNSGGCRKPSVLWYHDARTGRCALFLYNGCGGNQNRFRTRERCEEMCVTKS
uniref:BPTI/Kunitz inhibitor domain-containing protein n=1 Tax=Xiphophorus maculatus TaxID=8083 RepID=A0A3B5QNS1_XIPMA